MSEHVPPGIALLPKEVYVDDIIGGLTVVRLTPPDGPEIRFCLSADAARVLGIALTAAADIAKVTGWGAVSECWKETETRSSYMKPRERAPDPVTIDRAQVAALGEVANLPPVNEPTAVDYALDAKVKEMTGHGRVYQAARALLAEGWADADLMAAIERRALRARGEAPPLAKVNPTPGE